MFRSLFFDILFDPLHRISTEFCVETVAGLKFRGLFARSIDSLSLSLCYRELQWPANG